MTIASGLGCYHQIPLDDTVKTNRRETLVGHDKINIGQPVHLPDPSLWPIKEFPIEHADQEDGLSGAIYLLPQASFSEVVQLIHEDQNRYRGAKSTRTASPTSFRHEN